MTAPYRAEWLDHQGHFRPPRLGHFGCGSLRRRRPQCRCAGEPRARPARRDRGRPAVRGDPSAVDEDARPRPRDRPRNRPRGVRAPHRGGLDPRPARFGHRRRVGRPRRSGGGRGGDGDRVDALIHGTCSPTAVALTPNRQHPLGMPLVPARRSRLLDWVRSTDGVVIEDDYDGEFRYDGAPIGALQGLEPRSVIYAGTTSKTLAPGLRLGWLVL